MVACEAATLVAWKQTHWQNVKQTLAACEISVACDRVAAETDSPVAREMNTSLMHDTEKEVTYKDEHPLDRDAENAR